MTHPLPNDIVIVLTATIIPNSIYVEHQDHQQRRSEYLQAIDYYARFGEVFVLENSSYDILNDPDFQIHPNVHLRKFPQSQAFERGKGYQEFEMIDRWISEESHPFSRFIKITGRYIAQNFEEVFLDCLQEQQYDVIIEQKTGRPIAHTCLFYVTKSFYVDHFLGLYKSCNDPQGIWIEHVIRDRLNTLDNFRTFKHMPLITGVSGSSMNLNKITLSKKVKYYLRSFIHRFYKKYRII